MPQASDDPKVKAWVAAYRERNNNTEPDGYSLANYDGVHILAQALARAPSTDATAVRDALMATKNYQGLLFPYTFDQYGDVVSPTFTLYTVSGSPLAWNPVTP